MTDMPFAVEMFFDEEANKLVRNVWTDLVRAKITSSMIDGNYRPGAEARGNKISASH